MDFGDLWYRPGISRRDRRRVSITCAALSGAPFALGIHVSTALQSGDLAPTEMDDLVGRVADAVGADRARPLAEAVEQARAAAS